MRGWKNDTNCDNYILRYHCLDSLNLDIIGICETHLKGFNKLSVPGYQWFGQNRTKLHLNAKLGSGGVGFLIRDSIFLDFNVEILNSDVEGILWLSLKHKTDILHLKVCDCYLPPINSSRQVDGQQFFDNLLSQIYEFQNHAKIYICGDFNSRCGDLKDFIEGVDMLPCRDVLDFKVNKYGHLMIDFLLSSNMCMLNGRNSTKNDFQV